MDLIEYVFEKLRLIGRIARGQMVSIEYDIQYTSQKVKGSVLYDYLVQQPMGYYQPRKFESPDEGISRVVDVYLQRGLISRAEIGVDNFPQQVPEWIRIGGNYHLRQSSSYLRIGWLSPVKSPYLFPSGVAWFVPQRNSRVDWDPFPSSSAILQHE
ncbi:hypothetical protein KIW84_025070 [Lathyrus oleraceus]|uniref:Uncharacterized protein n=1 Tax=Pisum sativum TaxID=3888 RepID=A0A9D4YIH0_PEA|nr:hypothetical protein KIW84_025070 [Pisum sativum]